MTLAQLKDRLENMPPGGMVPRDWVLEQLDDCHFEPVGVSSWVDTHRAAEITGWSERKLRDRAVRWRGSRSPDVRVTKKNPELEGSPWLFCEEDCWAISELRGPELHVDSMDEVDDPNDPDAVSRHWMAKAIEGM